MAAAAVFAAAPEAVLSLLRDSADPAQILPVSGYLAAIGVAVAVSEHRALRA